MGPISPENISIQGFNGFRLTTHNECHWASLLELIRKGRVSPTALKRSFSPSPSIFYKKNKKEKKKIKKEKRQKVSLFFPLNKSEDGFSICSLSLWLWLCEREGEMREGDRRLNALVYFGNFF